MPANLFLFTSDSPPRAVRRYCFSRLLPQDHRALVLFGPEHPDGPTRRLDAPPTEDEAELHRASRYFGAWDHDEGALIEGHYGRLMPARIGGRVHTKKIGLVLIEDLRAIDHEAPLEAIEALAAASPATFAVRAVATTFGERDFVRTEYRYPVDATATIPEAGLLLDGKAALTWSDHI